MITTKEFIEILNDASLEYRSYSGRGMYGAYCVGVEVSDPTEALVDIFEALTSYYANGGDESERFAGSVLTLLRKTRTDNLGRDTIMYWPQLKWEEKYAEVN